MTDKGGYIKLYRALLSDEFWQDEEPFDKRSAWIDLLLRANYADNVRIYRGQVQKTKRGQIRTSVAELAERWNWSENKVRRYLFALKVTKKAQIESTRRGSIITIEKYAFFQDRARTDERTDERTDGRTGERTGGRHNKKDKEERRKEEGKHSAPTSSDSDMVPTDPDEQAAYLEELFDRLGIGKEADE